MSKWRSSNLSKSFLLPEYIRFLEINTKNGDQYLIGVATDYAQEYPDAPYYWKVNKNNQIDGQGTTNIEKYSLNFELKK